MIPGEYRAAEGEIAANRNRAVRTLTVTNLGDRPIQVGSHYHFYETNPALSFEREVAKGFRNETQGESLPPLLDGLQDTALNIPRAQYLATYGPTVGDKIRLGDTQLFAEIERDLLTYGDECKFGGANRCATAWRSRPMPAAAMKTCWIS